MSYPSNIFQSFFNPTKAEYNINSALMAKEQAFNAEQAQITRDYNAEQAQLQRDFEERMSNTAYSRAIADIKKAGLNPYIALTSGQATTPSGATAQASATTSPSARVNAKSNLGNFTKSVSMLVASAMQLALKL